MENAPAGWRGSSTSAAFTAPDSHTSTPVAEFGGTSPTPLDHLTDLGAELRTKALEDAEKVGMDFAAA